MTIELVSGNVKFSSGVLKCDCRAVVAKSLCRTWSGAGWWHADPRQNVDGQIWNPRSKWHHVELFLSSLRGVAGVKCFTCSLDKFELAI